MMKKRITILFSLLSSAAPRIRYETKSQCSDAVQSQL